MAGRAVVSSQIPFSLLRREFQPDLEFCQEHGIGVTPYQSLQAGLLDGQVSTRLGPAG
jgi:L-glyceraldehyde 3-phosphate reductase